jgi:hypothetical protein
MNTNFIRLSGVAGVLGGLIAIAGAFLAEPLTGQYLLGGLLTIVALIGVMLVLWREGAGRWGLFGILVALTGNLFFAIEQLTALAGLFYGLGLILLAIGLWKTALFPRWLPALWIAAPLVGLPGLVIADSADFLTTVATVAFGLAFIGAGYSLWKMPASESAHMHG